MVEFNARAMGACGVLLRLLLLLVVVPAASCTTFNNARPLSTGEHAASLTVGGPLTAVPGVGTIPLPNATLEGRHGLPRLWTRPLDVNYGLHVLPMVFGVQGAHAGATLQPLDQDGAWPALSVGERFFFFTNLLDPRKTRPSAFLMSQTDVTASWLVFDQLLYTGATMYLPLDAGARTPRFAPFLGVEAKPGLEWLRVQLETRWLSPVDNQKFAVVNWVGPADQGAITITLGVAVEFTKLFEEEAEEGAGASP